MVLSRNGTRLYVANGDSDSVSIISDPVMTFLRNELNTVGKPDIGTRFD